MAVTPAAVIGAAAVNSAANALTSGGTSAGGSQSSGITNASSYSHSDSAAAREFSARQAELAYERSKELWKMQAEFNSAEAQKARDWEQKNIDTANLMANTVYSRSVKDMIAAGINPVLAAGAGLGAAGSGTVTSGAAATAGMPQNFMANTVAGSESASQSHGENYGSSWNESLSGLAYLANAIKDVMSNMTSGLSLDINFNAAKEVFQDLADKTIEKADKTAKTMNPGATELNRSNYKDSASGKNNIWKSIIYAIDGLQHTTGGGFYNPIH